MRIECCSFCLVMYAIYPQQSRIKFRRFFISMKQNILSYFPTFYKNVVCLNVIAFCKHSSVLVNLKKKKKIRVTFNFKSRFAFVFQICSLYLKENLNILFFIYILIFFKDLVIEFLSWYFPDQKLKEAGEDDVSGFNGSYFRATLRINIHWQMEIKHLSIVSSIQYWKQKDFES